MSVNLLKSACYAVVAIAVAAWAFGWGSTSADAQGCCGGHGGHTGHGAASTGHQHGDVSADHAAHDQPVPPHGGQLTTAKPMTFEVVYTPQEIRVYLYGVVLPYPESAKDVTGEVSLQRPYDERATRVALRYVAQPAGQQDYLAAPVDLSRVRDGDLTATVKLANLPLQNRPGITFSQSVVVSKAKPQVTLAAVDQNDHAGIARQRVCPVTGASLDSMGGPVKVLVGGQPLYLCCKGCLGKVQIHPAAYLAKTAGQTSQVQ